MSNNGWPDDQPVTVVIPALTAASTLGAQLEAMRSQTLKGDFEVIVADNGSTDDTVAIAQSFSSDEFRVRMVREPRRGVNFARDAGISAATDGLVALCDADDIVAPEWLASLTAAYTDGVWLAGDLDYTLLNTAETRAMWGVGDCAKHRSERPYVDTAFGGNCAFTRKMWERVGGFDASLSGHGDETEFFLRAWDADFRVRWVPGAVLHCRLRDGLRVMARQRYRKGKSNAQMATRPGGQLLPQGDRWLAAKSWIYIVVIAPVAIISQPVRYRWVRLTFFRVGGVIGAIQVRRGGR